MTDEEKAKEITMNYFRINDFMFQYLLAQLDAVYNFYNGVLNGLAEGRKEGYEQGKNNERKSQCGKKNYEKDIARLEKENAELKAKLKWHDSENDFPPDMSDTGRFSINVWSSKKEVVYYDHVEQVWMSFDSDEVTNVTAWIEIPEYEG